MEPISVCDTKVIYDSEFEAEVAVAKTSWISGEEYIYYQCNRHYHISHKDPDKRLGAGKKHWRCPRCKGIEKRSESRKHRCRIPDNS